MSYATFKRENPAIAHRDRDGRVTYEHPMLPGSEFISAEDACLHAWAAVTEPRIEQGYVDRMRSRYA